MYYILSLIHISRSCIILNCKFYSIFCIEITEEITGQIICDEGPSMNYVTLNNFVKSLVLKSVWMWKRSTFLHNRVTSFMRQYMNTDLLNNAVTFGVHVNCHLQGSGFWDVDVSFANSLLGTPLGQALVGDCTTLATPGVTLKWNLNPGLIWH